MSPLHLPATVNEVTPSWLTRALQPTVVSKTSSVTSVESEAIGAGTGFSANLARLRLTYDGADTGGPETVIVKLPSGDRAIRRPREGDPREVRFYRQLASRVSMASPRCYFSAWYPDDHRSILLLEDLGRLRSGDQVAGCSLADAELTTVALARFHAGLWDSQILAEAPWVPSWSQGAKLFQRHSLLGWKRAMEAGRYEIPPVFQEFVRNTGPHIEAIRRRLSQPPATLSHGDYKLDNLFFGTSGPVAIDWALLRVGRGIYDLSHFLVSSMAPEVRRTHLDGLVRLYHETLVASGVAAYTLEDCHEDCGYAVLDQASRLQAITRFDVKNARGRQWVQVMMDRVADALSSVKTESLLGRLT